VSSLREASLHQLKLVDGDLAHKYFHGESPSFFARAHRASPGWHSGYDLLNRLKFKVIHPERPRFQPLNGPFRGRNGCCRTRGQVDQYEVGNEVDVALA
jgi:hypothetical protein